MTRMLAVVAAVTLLGAAPVKAQLQQLDKAKQLTNKAVDAENARLSAQTGQEVKRRGTSAPAPAPASGPGSVQAERTTTSASAPSTVAPGVMVPVTREVFAYEAEGRRDPFYSLILTEDLRPLLSDLKLVGILYAAASGRSVAIMRDVLTNAQYRVSAGQTIGRMRVAQIKPRAVIFTIDEFGVSRTDSLFMVDSTKVRVR
ncbi:MAG: hypothetical protein ABIY52_19315 [Gemmatimonadaceae bacterium]